MKAHRMKHVFLSILTVSFVLSCGNSSVSSSETEQNAAVVAADSNKAEVVQVSDDIINDILQSIPSPLEVSLVIKEVGSVYNRAELSDYNSASKFATNFDQALNLGVYGTDLGFANIYGKNQDALNYLNSVQKMAEALTIGQFFDYATLKRLAESADNLDELMQTTTSNFEKINYHLRQQKREYLSILLLTGGWIEATYITALVHQKSKNALLREKLGEQKIVLDRILLVLDVYKAKPGFAELIRDLKELQAVYSKVEIETVYGQPTMVEKNGMLVVVDNTKSVVKMTDRDVDTITSLIRSIRNKIIN